MGRPPSLKHANERANFLARRFVIAKLPLDIDVESARVEKHQIRHYTNITNVQLPDAAKDPHFEAQSRSHVAAAAAAASL
jgi:hypothetical protein